MTEYRRNAQGAKEKVVRRYKVETRVIQVPKAVEERAAWRRFGKAKEGNEGTTARSVEEISIEKPGQEAKSDLDRLAETHTSIFTCRKCRGPHSTLKCPYKDLSSVPGGAPSTHMGPPQSGEPGAGDKSGSGVYVPKHKRAEAAVAAGAPVPIEDLTTLRVTNLSEDAEEEDLRALFSRYGRLERVHVAKDRETNTNRGFAFVTFSMHEEADRARVGVNGCVCAAVAVCVCAAPVVALPIAAPPSSTSSSEWTGQGQATSLGVAAGGAAAEGGLRTMPLCPATARRSRRTWRLRRSESGPALASDRAAFAS